MFDVVIMGAGLCGLTTAYWLTQAGHRVLLLEGSNHVGGVIQSIEEAGFLLEAGPNTFQSSSQTLLELASRLGLSPVAASPLAQKRYLYLHQRLTPLPTNPIDFLTSPVLSGRGKLRLLQEPWRSRGKTDEETIAQWVRRRLGPEVLEHLVGPFISGVYAGDPEQLSLAAAFPQLAQWEQTSGSLFRGMLQARSAAKQSQSKRTPYQLMSFSDGMAALPQALAQALPPGCLRLETPVAALTPEAEGYRIQLQTGESLHARSVLLATPAGAAAALAPFLPQGAGLLREIPYVPLSVVHLGFSQKEITHPLDGFGFLIPRKAGIPTLGAIWASRLFPQRAPEGQVLFSCFLGGALQPEVREMSSEQVAQQVLEDLRTVFQQPHLAPTFSRVLHYPAAIPQYTLGHLARIQKLDALLKKTPGLFVTGNFLHGVSLQDCVKDAQQAASRVETYLHHSGSETLLKI